MKKRPSSEPMTKPLADEIQHMVDRETKAWDSQDADLLVSLFHPDMVWPWPKDENAHDPINWVCPMGRYNRDRWKAEWQRLFDTHTLIHNRRTTIKITVTEENDGAFAVVDVDTLWRHRQTGQDFHWNGRACKVYTKTGSEWKLISHSGLLRYDT
jgi:ketosteroid isomerase-like protein